MFRFLMVVALAFACVGVRANADTEPLEVVGDPEQVSQVPQFVLLTTEVKWYRKNCRTGKALLPDVELKGVLT